MNKKEKALEVFSSNFNCSQAVFSVFAEEYGLDKEIYLKIATSFGGGMRKGEACGAVTGALSNMFETMLGKSSSTYQTLFFMQKSIS